MTDTPMIPADEAAARVAAAYEAAADACSDYPRVAPDYDEWTRYDEQIAYSQDCIRSLATADPDGQAALARMLAEAEARGMRKAAGIAKTHHEKAKREYDELDDDASDFREGALWGRELIAREIADDILAAADKVAAK